MLLTADNNQTTISVIHGVVYYNERIQVSNSICFTRAPLHRRLLNEYLMRPGHPHVYSLYFRLWPTRPGLYIAVSLTVSAGEEITWTLCVYGAHWMNLVSQMFSLWWIWADLWTGCRPVHVPVVIQFFVLYFYTTWAAHVRQCPSLTHCAQVYYVLNF